MKQFLKVLGILTAGIVIGLVISAAVAPKNLGGIYNQVSNYFAQGISIGKSPAGDAQIINKLLRSTCTLIGADAQITATSSKAFDCAVSGAVSGDIVSATFTKAQTSFGHFSIVSANASTTAGYITVYVYNGTGATVAPSVSGIASTTAYTVSN